MCSGTTPAICCTYNSHRALFHSSYTDIPSHAPVSTAPTKKHAAAPPSVTAARNRPKPSITAVPPSSIHATEKQAVSAIFIRLFCRLRSRTISSHLSPSSRSRAARWFYSVIISTSLIFSSSLNSLPCRVGLFCLLHSLCVSEPFAALPSRYQSLLYSAFAHRFSADH